MNNESDGSRGGDRPAADESAAQGAGATMFCRKCGQQNLENNFKCVRCGEVLNRAEVAPPLRIPNYLAQAILVTVLCCLPLGIPAIVFSAQVNGKIQAGDIQGAMDSSRKAKIWCWWSFGVGLAVTVFYVLFYAVAIIAGIVAE